MNHVFCAFWRFGWAWEVCVLAFWRFDEDHPKRTVRVDRVAICCRADRSTRRSAGGAASRRRGEMRRDSRTASHLLAAIYLAWAAAFHHQLLLTTNKDAKVHAHTTMFCPRPVHCCLCAARAARIPSSAAWVVPGTHILRHSHASTLMQLLLTHARLSGRPRVRAQTTTTTNTTTMGEIADYQMMMDDITAAEEEVRITREAAEMSAYLTKESEFARMPTNWWQPGCPFRLK